MEEEPPNFGVELKVCAPPFVGLELRKLDLNGCGADQPSHRTPSSRSTHGYEHPSTPQSSSPNCAAAAGWLIDRAQVRHGVEWMADVEAFFRERATIEREYSAKLAALAKKCFEKKSRKTSILSVGDTPTLTPGSLERLVHTAEDFLHVRQVRLLSIDLCAVHQ